MNAMCFLLWMVLCGVAHAQVPVCVDESLIDPNALCTQEFAPVCGCDGVVYSNACVAQTQGGVTSWTEGTCALEGCVDLEGVEFGLCELALGVGNVAGSCVYVSGCGTVVGGVDYASTLFESMEACQSCLSLSSNSEGCTYPMACNYDSQALVDDGSCMFPPYDCPLPVTGGGCTYIHAPNYDANAVYDDGSCEFTLETTCVGDLNGDGAISVSDILAMLALFGNVC